MAMPAWVSEVGIAGTWLIAIAAIWGEGIRARIFRPKLQLSLVSSLGRVESQSIRAAGDPEGQPSAYTLTSARNYRFRVKNAAWFPAAQEVHVLITRFDKRGPDEQPQAEFSDEAFHVRWRPQALYASSRTIGKATVADADFLTVREDGLTLTLNTEPAPFVMDGEQHFWVTAIARGLNGESAQLRLRVDWNGQWHPGDTEMGQRLRINVE